MKTMEESVLDFDRKWFKKLKGKIPQPRGSRNVKQFLSCRTEGHSAKPQRVRDSIYKMFPIQKKLELFARVATDGWDTWGNQAPGSINWKDVKPLESTKPHKKMGLFY